jgi:hypothetical protein
MGNLSKALSLIFLLTFTSFVTVQPTIVKGTTIETNTKYPLLDENATIILLKGASYAESDYYSPHNTSEGFVPSSWLFAIFSTGNGTTGLTISAHDCNVTITSFSTYLENTEGYDFKVSTWLNYTVTGTGSQRLSYPALYHNNHNPTVYLDGMVREQGDGWSWANFGISVKGASSNVSIYQEYNTYMPPRNAPQGHLLSIIVFMVVIVVIIIFAIWLLYRNHRKTMSVKNGQSAS